jgi:hypothetical protein
MEKVTWLEELDPVFFWDMPWAMFAMLLMRKGTPSDSSQGPPHGSAPFCPDP